MRSVLLFAAATGPDAHGGGGRTVFVTRPIIYPHLAFIHAAYRNPCAGAEMRASLELHRGVWRTKYSDRYNVVVAPPGCSRGRPSGFPRWDGRFILMER